MPRDIRIYCEGHKNLRPSFDHFFSELRKRARERGCRLEVIAAGSGDQACKALGLALRSHPNAWNILLRDSEGPLPKAQPATFAENLAGAMNTEHPFSG